MDASVHLLPGTPALTCARASFLEVTFVGGPQLSCSPTSPPRLLTLGGLGLHPKGAWAIWVSQPMGPTSYSDSISSVGMNEVLAFGPKSVTSLALCPQTRGGPQEEGSPWASTEADA